VSDAFSCNGNEQEELDLAEEMEKTFHERLLAVEAMCAEQKAQIDGLVGVISDLLAAHTVLHQDLRLCTFLRDYIASGTQKAGEGGTSRTPASYFRSRAELWTRLLEETAHSVVFDQYWFRSMFWRKEERQRARLEKIRKEIERKLEF
jgi:hypothetical protein